MEIPSLTRSPEAAVRLSYEENVIFSHIERCMEVASYSF